MASMQQAFQRLCSAKMESFSFVHPEGTIVEITGKFSFPIDNVKKVDSIVNMQKYAKDGQVVFSGN